MGIINFGIVSELQHRMVTASMGKGRNQQYTVPVKLTRRACGELE